jgi:hypothetical protein
MKSLSIIFLFFITSCSTASTWPESTCDNQKPWLEFSELYLCIDKNNVNSLNIMNTATPSVSINYKGNEYIFIKQVPDDVTGGLHTKYKLTLDQYFSALINKGNDQDFAVAYKVHELESSSEITKFFGNHWSAYLLISNTRSFDEIFIINKQDERVFQIGGEFNQANALELLSKIQLPKI